MYQQNVRGVVGTHMTWFSNDWFAPTQADIDNGFPCTVEQMKEMAGGFLMTGSVLWRSDLNVNHGCSHTKTVGQLKLAYETENAGATTSYASPTMDAVCMMALTFHEID